MNSGSSRAADWIGDRTSDRIGTPSMPTTGRPPFDIPISSAAQVATQR